VRIDLTQELSTLTTLMSEICIIVDERGFVVPRLLFQSNDVFFRRTQ